jgi:phage tail-like protein
MPVIGQERTFHTKFKFVIEIDGLVSAAFQKCSELSIEVAKIEHWEGGVITPDKQPGRLTFADITLERGATIDRDFFDWMLDVANAARQGGLITPDFKRNGEIVQLDRDGATMRRWRFVRAWPMKYIAGDWDNGADENVIEKVTLAYDRFDLVRNTR